MIQARQFCFKKLNIRIYILIKHPKFEEKKDSVVHMSSISDHLIC